MNQKKQKLAQMSLTALDQEFQQLIFESVSTSQAFSQTDRELCLSASPCSSPNSNEHKCQCSLSNASLRSQEQQAEASNKTVRKLQFEIRKLKMQINLLRLQNDILGKNCNINKDEYYEGVINGMQHKIEELMVLKETESVL